MVAALAEAVAEEALGTGTDPPALCRSLSAEKKWNNQWENRDLCRTQQSSACKKELHLHLREVLELLLVRDPHTP
jgi:hypothetical protein